MMAAALRLRRATTAAWWELAVAAACLGIAALTNSMLGPPMILSDEYTYFAQSAELHARGDAPDPMRPALDLPNRLFFAIYSIAGAFPAPFGVARMLNVVVLGTGAFALLLAARRLQSPLAGSAIACTYALGALGSYSAYFMPETLYGALFIASCLAFAIALAGTTVLPSLAAGAGLAGLTFVKPHGWVVVGLFVAFAFIYVWQLGGKERSRATKSVLYIVLAFALAWSLLSALLPDVGARTRFLGALYGGQMPQMLTVALDASKYRDVGRLFLAHLVAVGVVAMPALCYGLRATLRLPAGAVGSRERFANVASSLCVCTLIALIAMVSLFTVSVAGSGGFEVVNRLHGRLYTFAIPLLVLVTVASPDARIFWRSHWLAIVCGWLFFCLLAVELLPRFTWYFDSAELYFGPRAPKATVALFGFLGAAIVIGLRRSRWGAAIGLLVAYVGSSVVSGTAVRVYQLSIDEQPADRAGKVARVLSEQTRSPIWVVGDANALTSIRVATYAPLRTRFVTPEILVSTQARDKDFRAIIVGDQQDLAGLSVSPRAEFDPLVVATVGIDVAAGRMPKQPPPLFLSFSSDAAEDVATVSGFHAREHWGAWSAEPRIVIRFARSLSGRTRVRLRGFAMPGNAGRTLLMHVGDEARPFVLQSGATETQVDFDITAPTDSIVIDGYDQLPVAGDRTSKDPRRLGIGLASMRVDTGGSGN